MKSKLTLVMTWGLLGLALAGPALAGSRAASGHPGGGPDRLRGGTP
jgi:hypothetical protein